MTTSYAINPSDKILFRSSAIGLCCNFVPSIQASIPYSCLPFPCAFCAFIFNQANWIWKAIININDRISSLTSFNIIFPIPWFYILIRRQQWRRLRRARTHAHQWAYTPSHSQCNSFILIRFGWSCGHPSEGEVRSIQLMRWKERMLLACCFFQAFTSHSSILTHFSLVVAIVRYVTAFCRETPLPQRSSIAKLLLQPSGVCLEARSCRSSVLHDKSSCQ